MSKTAITTDRAPAAIGPYSQAVRVGDFLFTSGQIALDPATMQLVEGGVEPQTRRVLANLSAVLAAAGASWSDVVKTTIYLTNLADFSLVNGLYGEVFTTGEATAPLPARSTVQVAALPRGAAIEIDLIVHLSPNKR